jgi:hypothetical protein
METKPLIVYIPEPYESGYCHRSCPLFHDDGNDGICLMDLEWYIETNRPRPYKGCPWYEGGEDE